MTPDIFAAHAHRLIDLIAEYRRTLSSRPVMATTRPGAVKALLTAQAPAAPEPFAQVLEDVERIILPHLSHWQHPKFFAYFPSNAALASVLGDFLSTGLGVLGIAWQTSPALSELEEVTTDWMRQLLGLSAAWQGVIQDTASTATLVALLCARERATDFGLARGGLQGEAATLVVYVSTQAHSSVEKAALLAGLGREQIRKVAVDEALALSPQALAAAIRDDLAAGRKPCAVVVTTGTTATTAVDPIAPVAALCREYGLWLHVDAAMGGSAQLLPECRWMWEGIEGADSVVVNPHKWLGAVFDCSLYYLRDPQHLQRVLSTNPSYLQTAADGQVRNYRDWGIPLGRRFRALKLWFLLRLEGVEALKARLRRDLANAQWLAGEVRAAADWKVVAPVPLQTVCVRHEPPGLSGAALDRHTLGWADRLNRSGEAWVTPATIDGKWMIRVSIGALLTEREHLAALWEAMQKEAACPDA
ncbi:MAG TPA: pyridoxal-dependent decarboxylase [Pseudomonadota bacterium]|nr:pyridoxal-dependent decarboxylase [Pseudomonadota bacterium]